MTTIPPNCETDALRARYAKREGMERRYSLLDDYNLRVFQERQRMLSRLLKRYANDSVEKLRLLEIGCGTGSNLLELTWLGFNPSLLVGNELLEDRVAIARRRLPEVTHVVGGDALTINFKNKQFDIVYQSTVFTSLLDPEFQQRLADTMWGLTKPGGGVLWYDFVFDNPRNPDVRKVTARRIAELFPAGRIDARRITLAPPLGRMACRLYPGLYGWLNRIPWLRTHLLCWIGKPLSC